MAPKTKPGAEPPANSDTDPEGINGAEMPEGAGEQKKGPRESLPTEIQNFLDLHAIPSRFTLAVNKRNPRSGNAELQKVYSSVIPTADELAKEFNTGDFIWNFSYYVPGQTARKKLPPIEFTISGEYFERLYLEEKIRKQDEDDKRNLRGGVMGRVLGQMGPSQGPQKTPMEVLKESLEVANLAKGDSSGHAVLAEAIKAQGESFRAALESLNKPRAPMPEWAAALLSGAATAAVGVIKTMVEKMMEKKTEGPDDMAKIERLFALGTKVKEFITPPAKEEKDKWDRMLDIGEMIITPIVDRLAKLPPEERKNDAGLKTITENKMFKEVASDPQSLNAFVASFYEKYGAVKTVLVLESLGYPVSPDLKAEAVADEKEAAEENSAPGAAPGAPGEE